MPLLVGGQHRLAKRTTMTCAIAAWTCAPFVGDADAWFLIGTALVAQLAVAAMPRRQVVHALIGAAVVAALAATLLDLDRAVRALEDVATSNDVLVVVAGGAIAVFLGGLAIAALLAPFAPHADKPDEMKSLANAGRYIGWLERTLLYGFIVAGAPGAAAVVVAAKSIARFPSFGEERFAEYYLIGTLASVLVAASTAVAVRAALDLGPLLS
jgi:hypothetical protein